MAALGGLLAALQQLRRAPGPLSTALAPLLLADLEWLGDSATSVRQLAQELLRREVEEDDGWELVEELTLDVPDTKDPKDPWLETLLQLLRCHSCSRKTGGAFCDTHVTTVEFLLELQPPLLETSAGRWQELRADDPKVQEDIDSCEALYGTDAVMRQEDRVEVKVEDVSVVYRFNTKDPMRVEVRGGPGATTGQERVPNAAYAVLQSFRGGALTLDEAVRLAAEARRSEPSTSSSTPLMLATPSSQWLGLRKETAAVKLDFFSPKEAAREAAQVVKKYLEQHKTFKPAGSAESVVNEGLATRFAEKLAQMRCDSQGQFVTPSLVFHGAPSQEVLRSICRRGFLMPGDWIEGTPDFLEVEHGNVKGLGVYTSPCLDTAARYSGVLDATGCGLVLVALAAPGICWYEKSRQHTQQLISNWFFPRAPKVGTEHNGWVWLGDAWHVKTDGTASRSALADVAFAPGTAACYDGAFHSRRFGCGTKVSEELVLASVDQLLPLLLLPFAARQDLQKAPLMPLPRLKNNGRRRRQLCGSNIYRYPSEELPEKELLCSKLLDAEEAKDQLWAVHVPVSQGAKSSGRNMNAIFLVDESLAGTEFKSQVVSLVSSLSGQLQAVSAAATFNSSGIAQSISFLPCETFQATFNSRWPPTAPGEALGDLASAAEYATDAAIAKLVKDTERHLQSLSPWVYLRAGQQLESRQRKTATVVQVLFDKSEPISLEVEWAAGKRQTSTKLSTTKVNDEMFLHAEFQEGVSHEFSARKLPWTATPADVAAETRFVIVLLSSFTSKERGSSVLGRLESRLQSCSTQLRCSGCCTTMIPLVLGGGAAGLRLATHLRDALSTRSSWWMPFYQADASTADTKAEVTRLMERITEDLGGWLKSWDEIEGTALVSLSLGSTAASVSCGFLESPTGPASWKVTLHSPGEASEARGQCILYKGELPRRDIWVDDDEYRLVTCEPPAISLTTGTIDHWRRALEISLALEKLAQQLRATSLASLDGGQISDWVTKLRTMAEALTPPRPDKNTLQALSRLPPSECAAMATRLRGLSGGLQRTANAIKDAAELHHAAEQEPSSAAWLRRASQMKYGVKVLQRAKKNLEAGEDQDLWLKQLDTLTALQLPVIEQELPSSMVTGCTMLQQQQELQRRAPELRKLRPSEALYACGALGVALRCRRSDAAEVEPWLLVVEHVSLSWVDTASAALTLDSGYHLRDDAGEVAPDVAVLACEPREFYHWFVTSEMYKSYLAMVFTRNPLGQVPGQPYALPVILWVKTAELLIGRAPRDAAVMPKEEADWFRHMLRIHLMAMHTVKQLTQDRGSMEQLAEALGSPEPAAALTEAEGGPQSVCLALAACCFAKNALPTFWGSRGLERANSRTLQRANSKSLGRQRTAEIEDAANWPRRLRRLALAMMAEAVSRACRRLVRSLCTPETEADVLKKLLWNALGVEESSIAQVTPPGASEPPELAKPEGHSDDCDVAHVQRRSALLFAPQGKYFQVALTNCTPQGVVGTLMICMALLQGKLDPTDDTVEKLMQQLWQREISMKAFVEAVLPGDVSPGAVQAALYVQGLRYHSAKQRRGGLAPLSAPEQILRSLAREQRHLAYLEQLRAKLQSQSSGARHAARSAQRQLVLSSFGPTHAGLPRLFNHKDVSDLNALRPATDQLELLPNGLLKHHCCFPSCPQYLQDLRTEKDKLAEVSEQRGRNLVVAQRRHGLFKHLAPMTWVEAGQEDGYVPMLHAAAHAALQNQKGKNQQHLLRSIKEQLEKRLERLSSSGASEVLRSKWLEDILEKLAMEMCR